MSIARNPFCCILASLAFVAIPASAAPVTYFYTGNTVTFTEVEGTGSTPAFVNADRITVSLTLATALGASFDGVVTPTAFSFSAGHVTLDDSVAGLSSNFYFQTDASGAITAWELFAELRLTATANGIVQDISTANIDIPGFGLSQSDGASDVICGPNVGACQFGGDGYSRSRASVGGNPGTWAIVGAPANVPEPSALALTGLALAILALARNGRKRLR